ncbi:MAG: hypothetical protein FWD90_11550 [Defluviitaleaceae bacterium]|nr:hypothetical protein [Defluviitaleaceae bacterium]
MNHREKLWRHFIESGNPMSYIAYRQLLKRDAARPHPTDESEITHENL